MYVGGNRLLVAPPGSSLPWSSDVGSGGAVTATVKATADNDYAGQKVILTMLSLRLHLLEMETVMHQDIAQRIAMEV